MPKLTKLEFQIMEALWTRGPCSIREIQEAFPERNRPAYSTIQTTVYRLEDKKALRRAKRISNADIFEAVISRGAAQKTLIYFRLSPGDGLEKYIGAWAHMLTASDDLIDLIHTHPFIADGGPDMQFNVYFPRERMYRVWVQFQRKGVVNTARFDVPVVDLK